MSIYRLRKRVKELGRMTLALAGMVIVLGAAMMLKHLNEDEAPTQAINANDLATASLSAYASLEATRVAKMAEMMLGLGGTYTASCQAVYVTGGEPRSEYAIEWRRAADASGNSAMTRTWPGAKWGECIQRMMAWRAGN